MRITKSMINENPVEAAAKLARPSLIPRDPEAIRRVIREQRRALQHLRDTRASLLTVEGAASTEIKKKIQETESSIRAVASVLIPHPETLPLFDTSCFSWRDAQGLPRLVPFPLNHDTFTMRLRKVYNGTRWSTHSRDYAFDVPTDFTRHYRDVWKTMEKLYREMKDPSASVEIAAQFSGVIPDDVRDLIAGVGEHNFPELYVVAEVKGWAVRKFKSRTAPARTVQADPLLVGWDGRAWRLIATFDVTDIEKLAADRSRGVKSS